MLEKILQWDRDVFVYLNQLSDPSFDSFWIWVTNIATWIPLYILFIGLLFLKFPRKEAWTKFWTLLGTVIFITSLTHLVKVQVARLRPNNTEEINQLIRILHSPTDFSFFSGHASFSFSVAILMVLFLKKEIRWALFFLIWPVLFASSRIFVGVHFPLDILVGALVGAGSGWLAYVIYGRLIAPGKGSARP